MRRSKGSASPHAFLVPGLDGTGLLFETFSSHLPSHWHTKTISYPRNETCSVSQLAELVNSERSTDTPHILIAESFGGPVALRAASTQANRLLGLVLVATFVSSPMPAWLRPILYITAGTIARLPLPRAIVSYFMMEGHPELFPPFKQSIESVTPSAIRQRLKDVACIDGRGDLTQCPVPILYIQAQNDRLVGPHHLEEIRRLAPNIATQSIDAPHLVLQSSPQPTAELIVDFAQRQGLK